MHTARMTMHTAHADLLRANSKQHLLNSKWTFAQLEVDTCVNTGFKETSALTMVHLRVNDCSFDLRVNEVSCVFLNFK